MAANDSVEALGSSVALLSGDTQFGQRERSVRHSVQYSALQHGTTNKAGERHASERLGSGGTEAAAHARSGEGGGAGTYSRAKTSSAGRQPRSPSSVW